MDSASFKIRQFDYTVIIFNDLKIITIFAKRKNTQAIKAFFNIFFNKCLELFYFCYSTNLKFFKIKKIAIICLMNMYSDEFYAKIKHKKKNKMVELI